MNLILEKELASIAFSIFLCNVITRYKDELLPFEESVGFNSEQTLQIKSSRSAFVFYKCKKDSF